MQEVKTADSKPNFNFAWRLKRIPPCLECGPPKLPFFTAGKLNEFDSKIFIENCKNIRESKISVTYTCQHFKI